jgi:hypothetical protein
VSRRRAAVVAWSVFAVTAALVLTSVVLAIADPKSVGPAELGPSGPTVHDRVSDVDVPFALLQAIVFSAFALVGAVVAARRPRNAVGWLFGVAALFFALGEVANAVFWQIAFGDPQPGAAADLLAWFTNWSWIPAVLPVWSFIPLLFPTGAPPSPRWRVVGWTAAVAGAVALVSTAFTPGPLRNADFGWIDNPLGIERFPLGTLTDVSFWVWVAAALAAIASLVVRYRRARGIERLQLRWVATAACLLLLSFIANGALSAWLGDAGWYLMLFGLLAIAAAVAIAMLRYRLYDIDVVINRTLVYGALTATLAGAYVGSVLLLQLVLSPGSDLAIAGSTLAVAALFRPARGRIQGAVDRRFYRRKYDAQRTLESFAGRMRNQVALDAIAVELRTAAAETMRPTHVSLWVRER